MAAASAPASPALALLLDAAADAIQAVRAGHSPAEALARAPQALRPGAQALAYHALRWLGSALTLRAALAAKPPAPNVDALLLTALALLWPPGGPPYAPHTLVDQAVVAARRRSPRASGFVNAVLRRFLREQDARVEAALRDPVARLNHPRWWIERLEHDWPPKLAHDLLASANVHPPMTLRVNARRESVAAYLGRLSAAGHAGEAIGGQAVRLVRPCPVDALPGFREGEVSVQDASAQRAAPLLLGVDGVRDERVDASSDRPLRWIDTRGATPRLLDACAAPGGKTAHLLELADLDVLALDSDPARLPRVEQTLARLGLRACTLVADAARPDGWWDGRPFDAILLDAPCSASGIVRRHPDIRWLRRSTDIAALAATQARLLDALWPLLAPGGRLLYATCSVFRGEGAGQIDAFLQRRSDAALARRPGSPGHLLPLVDNPDVGAERAPFPGGTGAAGDGFYYALIEKSGA